MSDFMTVLFFVSLPILLIAGCIFALVGMYKTARRVRMKCFTAKPENHIAKSQATAKPVSCATEFPTRTIAGEWFSAPDVSHLETPAFLRKQAA
jgi:hypothetical protein